MPDETPTPTPKPKRTRKATTPRKPKIIDPGIAAIRERMDGEVAAYRIGQKSSGVLQRIQKLLQKLTPEDRMALVQELSQTQPPNLLKHPLEIGVLT